MGITTWSQKKKSLSAITTLFCGRSTIEGLRFPNSAINGVLVWVAMADAQSANRDRHAVPEALCLDAACMNDPDVLGTSRVT